MNCNVINQQNYPQAEAWGFGKGERMATPHMYRNTLEKSVKTRRKLLVSNKLYLQTVILSLRAKRGNLICNLTTGAEDTEKIKEKGKSRKKEFIYEMWFSGIWRHFSVCRVLFSSGRFVPFGAKNLYNANASDEV